MSNFPFSGLNDPEFNLLFDFHNILRDNPQIDEEYEHNISNTLNINIEEVDHVFDTNEGISFVQSLYYTQNQCIKYLNSTTNNDLSLFHLNIRSVNKNFEQLSLLLDNVNIESLVIGLTETWLTDTPHTMYHLPGHDLIFNNRVNRRGGGVALYVPVRFNYTTDVNVMNQTMETVFIEIALHNKKNIIIGTIYRPPSADPNNFLHEMQQFLSNPLFQNKHCFLMGDFNIDLLKYTDDNLSHDFFDTLSSFSFLPLITRPTRLSQRSYTLIDNIFSNVDLETKSGVVISDISDHCPIFATVISFFANQKLQPSFIMIRKITAEKIARLKNKLNTFTWAEVLTENDVNRSYDKFAKILTTALNECIPFQQSKPNNKQQIRKPWVSKLLLKSIKKKNNLYFKYRSSPTDNNRNKYVKYKNLLTSLLRAEERRNTSPHNSKQTKIT